MKCIDFKEKTLLFLLLKILLANAQLHQRLQKVKQASGLNFENSKRKSLSNNYNTLLHEISEHPWAELTLNCIFSGAYM